MTGPAKESPRPSRFRAVSAALVAATAIYLSSRDTRQNSSHRPHGHAFPSPPFVLRSSRVSLPNGRLTAADIYIDDTGIITTVLAPPGDSSAELTVPFIDVGNLLVMPGLVDPHVHVNSPGRTAWEGFASAARAAAAGGTTTILDMPLNSVPATVSMAALAEKAQAIVQAAPDIDVGIIGGLIPGNLDELPAMFEAGVLAFKSFMVDSQSTDFPHVTLANLSSAMHALASIASSPSTLDTSNFPPYILHAELPPATHKASLPYAGPADSYPDYLASRPESWETEAVSQALHLSERSGCRIHVAHVSSANAADMIAAHRSTSAEAAARVSAETCPQYLLWTAEEIPNGRPEYKCAPPIRPAANRARLWQQTGACGVGTDVAPAIQMVVSDHSPTEPALKKLRERNVRDAWGGIAGLQYRLQATWTASVALGSGNGPSAIARLTELLSGAPARIFGLGRIKGSIAPGRHADFIIWDPDAHAILRKEHCMHRHKVSPFIGMNLTGVIHWTLLRGRVVYSADDPKAPVDPENSSSSGGRVLFRTSENLSGQASADTTVQPSVGWKSPADFADSLIL